MDSIAIFAERLKQVREEKKMTQKDFADFLQIRQQTLSGYETGKICPSLEVAAGMAQSLDVSLDWLCGNSENKSTKQAIKTCADAISVLFQIDLEADIQIHDLWVENSKEYHNFILINNEHLEKKFLPSWEKMLELFHSGTISQDLYELWIKEQIRIYSEKPLNPLSDLPF